MTTTSTTNSSETFAIDAAHTTVGFVVRHLMISKVRGRFTAVSGTIAVPAGGSVPTAIDVTVGAASVDTREEQRDGHLKSADFFDVENYPSITFKSTAIDGGGEEFTVRGDLTLHGVTREIELQTTFEGRGGDPWGGTRIGYEAHGKISRKDFGMGWNQALEAGGIVVGDEIKIELNVEAIAQQ